MTILAADSFWYQVLFGTEKASFIIEVVLRTLIMFLVIILGLRILGKRGVKQLSVFELVVIIGLGSAAGDPMFYQDVGIIFSVVVFVVIILLYAVITYFVGKSKRLETLLEGKPICLIEEGTFSVENFKKENLSRDEFFSELRLKGVFQLGQIETAIEETSGDISVFFYSEENTKPGLSVMLGSLQNPLRQIEKAGLYSCTFCGYTEEKVPGPAGTCTNCKKEEWVEACTKRRVT